MPAKFTETFTDGLTHCVVPYITDAGIHLFATTRQGYTESGLDGFTPSTTGVPNLPTRFRMRYLHLLSRDAVNGRRIKRKVPCSAVAIAQYFQPVQDQTGGIEVVTVDGIIFYVMGYTGEYIHKTRG